MNERQKRSNRKNGQDVRYRRAAILLAILTLAVGITLAFFYIRGKDKPGAEQTPSPGPTEPAATGTATPEPTPAGTPEPAPTPTPTPTPEPTPDPDKDMRSTRKNDVKVKALYLNPGSVRNNLDHYIDLANRTEINAFVIDIKRDEGIISYDSDIPLVNAANGDTPGFDIREVTKKLHDNNIIAIARLVTFKDTTITKYKPELAIKTADGGILEIKESGGFKSRWLDPTNRETWDYILSIVQEAV
ncbi:MAG TPA: putative glycoside hydrolase, partial [Thermoclostridium sp.]|nr:putative glycoside hydrolase [Thermoclostridium sp.]